MNKSPFNLSIQNHELSSKIIAGLERISEVFRSLLWKHAKVIGLSPIQIQLLIFIDFHDEALCNVSYLAKEFNVSKPTISDAVKVLYQKGLIEKHASPIDKRAYSIVIRPKGQQVIVNAKQFTEPIQNIINTLVPKEQENLFHTISTLILNLNKTGLLEMQRMCYNCKFYEKKEAIDFCNLLGQPLAYTDIRLDCPEFRDKT